MSLQSNKINDGLCNKMNINIGFSIITKNKPNNVGIHIETIAAQTNEANRALKEILPRVSKDLYGMNLRFFPVLTCLTDDFMATRLKKVAKKHSQIISNIKTYEINDYVNIDIPLSSEFNYTLRKLIMYLRDPDGECFTVTITSNWR